MSFSRLVQTLLASPAVHTAHVVRSGTYTQARLAYALQEQGRPVVLVAEDFVQYQNIKIALELFAPAKSQAPCPEGSPVWKRPFISLPSFNFSQKISSFHSERVGALYSLQMTRLPHVLLMSTNDLLLRLPPKSFFSHHEFSLAKGMEMSPDLIVEQLLDWGYSRNTISSLSGEFAARGDILDVYCSAYPKPFRIEFFGDIIEEIRFFEPSNQRSIQSVNEVHLLPARQNIFTPSIVNHARSFWKELVQDKSLSTAEFHFLERALEKESPSLFVGMTSPKSSFIEEWIHKDSIFIVPDMVDLRSSLFTEEGSLGTRLKELYEYEELKQDARFIYRGAAETCTVLEKYSSVVFDKTPLGVQGDSEHSYSFPEKRYTRFQDIFPEQLSAERPWQAVIQTIQAWSKKEKQEEGHERESILLEQGTLSEQYDLLPQVLAKPHKRAQLIFSFSSEKNREKFLKLVAQDGIYPKLAYSEDEHGVFALLSMARDARMLLWDTVVVLGEDVLQPQSANTTKRSSLQAFKGLDRYDNLKDGDFLVHRDYGVGVFAGLHRLRLNSIEADYLLLQYAGDDKLYLPVDRFSLIQRFKGVEGEQLVLDKLGGNFWSASKDKAKKAIEKIAADLVEMYALRKVVKSFSYSPIGELYREFEASFIFDETPDQARAIEEVLSDMERAEPMDRLICGDVGFGKTEVAVRAAARAALEGRQVVFLCPTTILAEQHYQTFRRRLSGLPLRVGMLSRFVSKAEQKKIIEATAQGQIDVLIGTHRLLSKDLNVPNLGLLILDEEQRFGVRHKERLKEIRKNVDALTLSATPIPRTLQLSLSGIRELSVIETPPVDRKPVVTALMNRDDQALREVIERELDRNGQVFWVYNRVENLPSVVAYVQKLCPHARIGVAHGKMSEKDLEDTMHKFWHQELDILIATSIIESGLDFPNANTLIVDQAHMFGLGQLYQLRGRVGRSEKQAFAIFVTPELDKLSEIARQRLRIILEMDYLGAGFQVAMEDLRIRGAGNILGESQTGHMNRLGLDLFLEMLEEAVAKVKGSPLSRQIETELSLGIAASIPETYMKESKDRLFYYKRLTSVQSEEAQKDILAEIRDIYGPIPAELEVFSDVLVFKRYLSSLGIEKADIYADKIKLSFNEKSAPDPERLISYVTASSKKGVPVKLLPPCILEVPVPYHTFKENKDYLTKVLSKLTE